MKKLFAIVSALVLLAFCSCEKITLSGINIEKEFSIEGSYSELQVENAFDVTVSDKATQITVTTDENVMPKVVVGKDGNVLKIYLEPLTLNTGMDLKVVLPYNPDLKSVELSGASTFNSEFGLDASKIDISLSGASEFYCDLKADKINMGLSGASEIEGNVAANSMELVLSGASDATLTGKASKLNIELSGASNIVEKMIGNKYALVCDQCEGEISGASNAYIHCDGTIKVELSGASNLYFTGNAFTGDSSTSGGSHITHKQ